MASTLAAVLTGGHGFPVFSQFEFGSVGKFNFISTALAGNLFDGETGVRIFYKLSDAFGYNSVRHGLTVSGLYFFPVAIGSEVDFSSAVKIDLILSATATLVTFRFADCIAGEMFCNEIPGSLRKLVLGNTCASIDACREGHHNCH